jgi:hypothetical protein
MKGVRSTRNSGKENWKRLIYCPHERQHVNEERDEDDGLEEDFDQSHAAVRNLGLVLTFSEGGHSCEIEDSTRDSSRAVEFNVETSRIPGFVGEEDDENEESSGISEDEPKYRSPLVVESVDHESSEEWTTIRRSCENCRPSIQARLSERHGFVKTELTEEDCDPDTDFLRPKMLEEDVVNEGQTDSLPGGKEDGGERSEDVVDFETRCES